MSGLARSCPTVSKHGKTKISANQHYTCITAAWLTSHVWDDLTFPGISIAVLKRNLHAPVWVTSFCKRLTPHAGCFCRVNVLCFYILFESGICFQQLSDPYNMNSLRVGQYTQGLYRFKSDWVQARRQEHKHGLSTWTKKLSVTDTLLPKKQQQKKKTDFSNAV